jgi:hypothetical protein
MLVTNGVGSASLGASADTTYQEQAKAKLHHIWQKPVATPKSHSVPAAQLESLARKTLDTMLVRTFRVTPWPADEEYHSLLDRVTHWVRRGKPVHVMLGYGPMKNPKTTDHAHADWAEFFALGHLCAWHNKVCSVYPPGLKIKIIFDDSTVRMANQYPRQPMDEYINSVGKLIRDLDYESFIPGTMRQSSFAWLFNFGLYQVAAMRVRRWERDPANQAALERMLEFSRRNLAVPKDLNNEEQENRFRDAARRYRIYWEALQMSRLSRFGNKLVAMYMDGNQHHLKQSAALHLASIGKQQITQPWQGAGALRDNGHGKLVPIVLTSKRLHTLRTESVPTPGFLPGAAFESIHVCIDRFAAAPK